MRVPVVGPASAPAQCAWGWVLGEHGCCSMQPRLPADALAPVRPHHSCCPQTTATPTAPARCAGPAPAAHAGRRSAPAMPLWAPAPARHPGEQLPCNAAASPPLAAGQQRDFQLGGTHPHRHRAHHHRLQVGASQAACNCASRKAGSHAMQCHSLACSGVPCCAMRSHAHPAPRCLGRCIYASLQWCGGTPGGAGPAGVRPPRVCTHLQR